VHLDFFPEKNASRLLFVVGSLQPVSSEESLEFVVLLKKTEATAE